MLTAIQGIRPAPYLARAKWVQVSSDAQLEPEAIEAYVAQAHRLAFLALPRSVREQLAPAPPVA